MNVRVGLLLVALFAVSCGSPSGTVTGSGLRPAPDADVQAGDDARPDLGDVVGAETSEASEVDGGVAPADGDGPSEHRRPGFDNDIPLDIDVEPACGTRGSRMKVTVVTIPDAAIGLAVEYSDAGHMPDFPARPVRSDAEGRFEWSWVLRPDTPIGPALVRVAAGRSGAGGAAGEAPFDVRKSC